MIFASSNSAPGAASNGATLGRIRASQRNERNMHEDDGRMRDKPPIARKCDPTMPENVPPGASGNILGVGHASAYSGPIPTKPHRIDSKQHEEGREREMSQIQAIIERNTRNRHLMEEVQDQLERIEPLPCKSAEEAKKWIDEEYPLTEIPESLHITDGDYRLAGEEKLHEITRKLAETTEREIQESAHFEHLVEAILHRTQVRDTSSEDKDLLHYVTEHQHKLGEKIEQLLTTLTQQQTEPELHPEYTERTKKALIEMLAATHQENTSIQAQLLERLQQDITDTISTANNDNSVRQKRIMQEAQHNIESKIVQEGVETRRQQEQHEINIKQKLTQIVANINKEVVDYQTKQLENVRQNLNASIEQQGAGIKAMQAQQGRDIKQNIAEACRDITEKQNRSGEETRCKLTKALVQDNEKTRIQQKQHTDNLKQDLAQVTTTLAQQTEHLENVRKDLKGTVRAECVSVKEMQAQQGRDIKQNIAEACRDITEKQSKSAEDTRSKLAKTLAQENEKTRVLQKQHADAIKQDLAQVVTDTNKRVVEYQTTHLENIRNDLKGSLSQECKEIKDIQAHHATQMEQALAKTLANGGREMVAIQAQQTERAQRNIVQAIEHVSQAAVEHLEKHTNAVGTEIKRVIAQASEWVTDQQSQKLSTQINETLKERLDSSSKKIKARQTRETERIHHKLNEVIAAVHQTSAETQVRCTEHLKNDIAKADAKARQLITEQHHMHMRKQDELTMKMDATQKTLNERLNSSTKELIELQTKDTRKVHQKLNEIIEVVHQKTTETQASCITHLRENIANVDARARQLMTEQHHVHLKKQDDMITKMGETQKSLIYQMEQGKKIEKTTVETHALILEIHQQLQSLTRSCAGAPSPPPPPRLPEMPETPISSHTAREERPAHNINIAQQTDVHVTNVHIDVNNRGAPKNLPRQKATLPPQEKHEDDRPEEEDPDEPIDLPEDNQELHLKDLIFQALQMKDDAATRKRLRKLQNIERPIRDNTKLSLYSNTLDILCQTPSNRWPLFEEDVCPICNEKFENATQKNAHIEKKHSEHAPDFIMQSLCKLFDCEIKHYEGTPEDHRETGYEPHCHYPLCRFSSEDYTAVLRHRKTHQNWNKRIRILGPFWARLKEEVLQGETLEHMPSAVDLLGQHTIYSCPKCNFEHHTEEKVIKHARHLHKMRDPRLLQRDQHYELAPDVEFAQMMQQQDPGAFIDQTNQFLEARETLTCIGWNYEKFCQYWEHPDKMYYKVLRLKNLTTCARALQDIKEWRRSMDGQLYPAEQLKMTSSVAELLHACQPEDLPYLDGRKECHICHKLYQYNADLKIHMEEAHGTDLEPNAIKRFVQHVTGKKIISVRINALREMEVEDTYPLNCPAPNCTFRTVSPESMFQHLVKMNNHNHARAAKLIQTLGAFWGPMKAFVEQNNALPKLRDLLGYTDLPYKLCTFCHKILSTNKIEDHLKTHKEREIDPLTQVETVKYWTEFEADIIPYDTKHKEWCKLVWNGTREDVELMTDYMWRLATVETDEDRRELRELEHIMAQRQIAYWTEEEEANERQQFPDENSSDTEEGPQYEITPERIVVHTPAAEPEPEPEEISPDLEILGVEQHKLLELITSDEFGFNEIINILNRGLKQTEEKTNLHLNVLEQFNRYNLEALRQGYECYQCHHKARNETALYTHMAKAHNSIRSDWFLASLEPFLGCQCIMQIKVDNVEIPGLVSCCWHPKCKYCQADKSGLKVHIRNRHKRYYEEIEKYGIVLATLRAHLKHHQFVKWQDILTERSCMTCDCGTILSDQTSMNKHWAQAHNKETIGNWRAITHVGQISINLTTEQIERPIPQYVAPQNLRRVLAPPEPQAEHIERGTNETRNTEIPEAPTVEIQERPAIDNVRITDPVRPHNPIPQQHTAPQEEDTTPESYWNQRRMLLRGYTDNGINMINIKPQHASKVKEGLRTLFKEELLPLITAEDEWDTYEGKYMETLHRMRTHITQKQGRDPNKIYTYQTRNKDIDAMTLRALSHQKIETKLYQTLKYIDKLILDAGEADLPRERRNTYLNKVSQVLNDLYPDEADVIMEELTGTPEHQQRVLEWIAGKILEASQTKVEAANTRTAAKVIRQMYHEDPGSAFKRYVDPSTSPSCEIPLQDIEEYYGAVWAQETEPTPSIAITDVPKHIETDLSDDIIKFITCEENIKKVVKSRRKQSALGPDGIGYRIYQLGGAPAIQYLKTLFARVLAHKKVPQDWLEARTILLHKKGAEDNLSNWRPISITCCTYRIFTALLSRALQTLNQTEQFYSKTQKGFIQKCNGCTEHSILVNELMAQANRDKTSLIATTIDCTNAFGSVPHALIFEVMKAMNIPSIVQHIVKAMYTNASTRIHTKAGTTNKISWRRGVKQGCPLSPLLFNMCLEPLLYALRTNNKNDGLIYGSQRLQVQAYADDVVLLAETPHGMQNLLDTTVKFMNKSLMSINPAKCVCASYMINRDRRRCSLPSMKINGQEIKCLTLAESCKYLGSPLAANAKTRLKANEIHIAETEILLEKVIASELSTNQKLHAIKTFVIPHLDFRFLNTDMSRSRIQRLNKKIRGSIATMLKVKGLPVVNIHTSWRDGGLSIPSLQDRQDVLCIRAFYQMYTSSDDTTRELFKMMIESEKKARKVGSENPGEFLNWNGYTQEERKGNRTLISRTRKTAERRHINIKDNAETLQIEMNGKLFLPKVGSKLTLGRFITSQIRKEYLEARKQMPTTCDCLVEAVNNPDSNYMVKGTKPYTNGLVRFMIAARNNLLPTPANIERWQQREHQPCQCGCKGCEIHTLSHILNSCGYNRAEIIMRHDQIVSITRELLAQHIRNAELLADNSNVLEANRPEKPDLVINSERQILIIDITCPYGGTSQNQRSLERAYNQKITKYEELRQYLQEQHQKTATVIPIVISSLGIAHRKSIQLLTQILKLQQKDAQRFTQRATAAAIRGSLAIWQKHIHEKERENTPEIQDEERATRLSEEDDVPEEESDMPYEIAPLPLSDEEIVENSHDLTDLDPRFEGLFQDRTPEPSSADEDTHHTSPPSEMDSE